jgi:signal transduction histidine kinase
MRILYLEDNPDDAILVKKILRSVKGYELELEHVDTLAAAIKRLVQGNIDVVLSDIHLPDSNGLDTYFKLQENANKIPIVLLTGTFEDGQIALEALRRGAQDYLMKSEITGEGLMRSLYFAVERHRLARLLDDHSSALAHELRTPLTVIREGVQLELDGAGGETPEGKKKRLSLVLKNIDRLSKFTTEILDVAKMGSNKMRLVMERSDMTSLAMEVIEVFTPAAKKRGIEIRKNFDKGVSEVYLDRARVTQVLVNLMDNALKFIKKGHIEVSVAQQEGFLLCSVADTGGGISPEETPKAFEKFEQFNQPGGEQRPGTGLGLAITKGLVELHGGKIWVESEWGIGTKFFFTLPLYSARELFRLHMMRGGISQARLEKTSLSIVGLHVKDFEAIEQKLAEGKMASLMGQLEAIAKKNLRNHADNLVQDAGVLWMMLPLAQKEAAHIAVGRIKAAFQDYLRTESLPLPIELESRIATFPQDGQTEEALFAKIGL